MDDDRIGGSISIDDAIEEMSDERFQIAFERAEREFSNCVADYDSEEFRTELAEQLKMLVLQDEIEALVDKGLLVATGVNEHGIVQYDPTPLGEAVIAEIANQRNATT